MQKSIYTGGGGREGAIFREHENRTLAPCCVPSIYMIYVYTVSRARACVPLLLHESAYTHTCA